MKENHAVFHDRKIIGNWRVIFDCTQQSLMVRQEHTGDVGKGIDPDLYKVFLQLGALNQLPLC